MPSFEYIFPAIRGIQAGREYYVSMCPLRYIPKIFIFDEEDELSPDLRAQRVLNKSRIPEIATYLLKQVKSYVFSALTASIDGEVRFEPLGSDSEEHSVGRLRIPMSARFVINDGQHRRAGIEAALRECPELGDETIAVVFFHDVGLHRCQQMFADLNRYAIRPTTSLSILYDHRDEDALVTKELLQRVLMFKDLTEKQRSTLSNRSLKLFTLSGIHNATQILMADQAEVPHEQRVELAASFWSEVARHIPEWGLAKERKVSAADLRRDYVHSHALALAAIARAGRDLLRLHPRDWKQRLEKIATIDWSRGNTALWEGRAMTTGRVSKRTLHVTLTGNAIKKHLGLKLSDEERELERQHTRPRHATTA
jgi:DNA sulfur modification protein DndB